MIDKLNQIISLFIESFKMMGRGKIWLVLLLLSGLNALILYAHVEFLSGLFYLLITWWTTSVSQSAGMVFTHYPGHYLALPYYFGLASLIPGFLLEGLVLGWAALYFRKGYLKGASLPTSFGFIAKRWIPLTGCWVVLKGLTMIASIYLPDLLEFFHEDSPRRLLAVEFVIIPFILTLILALLYFTFAAIAIEGRNLAQGLSRSLKLFFKRPLTSFFLAAMILSGPYLMTAIASKSGNIISKFHPELVSGILFAGLAVELIANFLWTGTAVRFLLEEETD